MPKRSSKAPRDLNQLAAHILATATGEAGAPTENPAETDPARAAAKLLGSLGGRKGGPARAKALSKTKRSAIAKKAARARWG